MPPYSIHLKVDKTQVEGGRIQHIALIENLQKARRAFLALHNMTEERIVGDVGLVIGGINIKYLGAAREGETLEITVSFAGLSKSQKVCTLSHKVKTSDTVIALAKTDVVFVDTLTEKATPIPEKLLRILEGKEARQKPTSRL